MAGEVEVGLLEREAEAGDVINRMFHRRDTAPEVTTDGKVAERDAATFHAFHVEPRVFLLVPERPQNALTEGGGRIWKFQ